MCLPKQGDSLLFVTPHHPCARAELVFLKHLVESKGAEEGIGALSHEILLLSRFVPSAPRFLLGATPSVFSSVPSCSLNMFHSVFPCPLIFFQHVSLFCT